MKPCDPHFVPEGRHFCTRCAMHVDMIKDEAYEKRIAELEFKVKLGDQFKERAHCVAKATQEAWEETVDELKAENARLREAVGNWVVAHYKVCATLRCAPDEEAAAVKALLGGGENV